jgi:hypothetical protein
MILPRVEIILLLGRRMLSLTWVLDIVHLVPVELKLHNDSLTKPVRYVLRLTTAYASNRIQYVALFRLF